MDKKMHHRNASPAKAKPRNPFSRGHTGRGRLSYSDARYQKVASPRNHRRLSPTLTTILVVFAILAVYSFTSTPPPSSYSDSLAKMEEIRNKSGGKQFEVAREKEVSRPVNGLEEDEHMPDHPDEQKESDRKGNKIPHVPDEEDELKENNLGVREDETDQKQAMDNEGQGHYIKENQENEAEKDDESDPRKRVEDEDEAKEQLEEDEQHDRKPPPLPDDEEEAEKSPKNDEAKHKHTDDDQSDEDKRGLPPPINQEDENREPLGVTHGNASSSQHVQNGNVTSSNFTIADAASILHSINHTYDKEPLAVLSRQNSSALYQYNQTVSPNRNSTQNSLYNATILAPNTTNALQKSMLNNVTQQVVNTTTYKYAPNETNSTIESDHSISTNMSKLVYNSSDHFRLLNDTDPALRAKQVNSRISNLVANHTSFTHDGGANVTSTFNQTQSSAILNATRAEIHLATNDTSSINITNISWNSKLAAQNNKSRSDSNTTFFAHSNSSLAYWNTSIAKNVTTFNSSLAFNASAHRLIDTWTNGLNNQTITTNDTVTSMKNYSHHSANLSATSDFRNTSSFHSNPLTNMTYRGPLRNDTFKVETNISKDNSTLLSRTLNKGLRGSGFIRIETNHSST